MRQPLDAAHRAYIRAAQNLPPEACLELAASTLPPPQMPDRKLIVDSANSREPFAFRCACDKLCDRSKFPTKHSGVINYTDNVCPGCEKQFKDLPVLVCVRCRKPIIRLEPLVDKTGFAFRRGRVYHVERCQHCVPGCATSPIVEKILHDRQLGKK